jgi:hypothetical protein
MDFTLSNKHGKIIFIHENFFFLLLNLVIKNSISNLWSHGIDYIISNQYENTEKFERKEPLTREIALERYCLFTFSGIRL